MSSGMYHMRWANASNDGRNSTTVRHNENVTQTIAPHTYGTSWNSVRWNKPLENGSRTGGSGYWNRSMPFFESISKDFDAKSSYSISPSRRFGSQLANKSNTELKNSGPYGRERSVCFRDNALSLMNDKTSNRTSRLSWLSDNLANRRNRLFNNTTRNSRENNAFTINSRSLQTPSSTTRSFPSEVRKAIPASLSSSSSSVSRSLNDKPFLGDTLQTISSSNHGSAAVKADRPWRRRMVDAARLREAHGDEIGGAVNSTLMTIRAGRSNVVPNGHNSTNNSGDELRTSLNALKTYIDEQTTNFYRQNNRFSARDSRRGHSPTRWNSGRFSEHMSRSYSPIRPRPSACNNMKLSKYNSVSTDMLLRPLRSCRQSHANDAFKNEKSYVLDQVIRKSSVPETVCEHESNGRLQSNRDRTLRHQLRLNKLGMESDSSSDTEQQQTEERKRKSRKRLRKKSSSESKSESKQLPTSAEKGMPIADNNIIVEIEIRNENVAQVEKMEQNQLLHSSQTSSSFITFPVICNERSELRVKCNQVQPKRTDRERKDGVIRKGLQLIVKKKKCDNTTGAIDRKKEVMNGIVGENNDNKCMECDEISRGMRKMLNNNDTQLIGAVERRCSDRRRLSASLLSPTTLSSLNNSSNRNTTMSTSTDNHFEANEKPRDDMAQFNSSDEMKHSKLKFPAPVPGTWKGPDYREINISHNKRLQRSEICNNEKVYGIITTKFVSCAVPVVTVRATKLKYHRPVQITVNYTFHQLFANNEEVSFSQKYFRFIKVDKKLLAVINATIKVDTSLISRRRSVMASTTDTIKMKKRRMVCSVIVEEPITRMITFQELICKRSHGGNLCRAQVTVLTSPLADVNFYRCLKRVQIVPMRYPISIKKISTKQAYIVEEGNAAQKSRKEINYASNQLLSREISTNQVLSENDDEIILSDRSLLQKHANYKREKWRRMRSEPVELGSRKSSSSPLPVSELKRACAVRILEPTRQVPYITAPSRSRLGSVEVDTVSTPVRTYGEQLLSKNYYNVKNSEANMSERPMSLTKPSFEFDPAMSPFEQILQNQAFKLRKVSTFSDSDIRAVQDTSTVDETMQLPIRSCSRHPSAEGSSLASNFTAAVAAAAHQPHERYAAHISVSRLNGSRRQSAASTNSHNSDTSETKTLQLNEMIDQARYRHNQRKDKFKEAIAYLDQIFEDLRKEGDQIDNMQRSRGTRSESRRKGTSKGGTDLMNVTASQPVKLQQRNGNTKQPVANMIGQEKMDSRQVPANRHSLYVSKPKITGKHCSQKKASSFEQTSSDDVNVSETVALPLENRKLKGERMNFTRRWLIGDVKPWTALQPKPDLILGGVEEEPDIDERSIGSCSAEIAAINSLVCKKKKARDVPDIIQNVTSKAKYAKHSNAHQMDRCIRKGDGSGSGQNAQKADPIKPLPVKAHPTFFNFPTGSTGNLNNFNNLSQSLHYSNAWTSNCDINRNQTSPQRIPSQNRISEQRCHGSDTISWRSPPHHSRYNTLSSPRSEEVQLSTRKTGAFTPVQPPNAMTTRGSVASLPDSSTIRPQPLHGVDPFVTIDALVAELELNTDQALIASKRRSFPTGNEFFAHYGGYHEKPISSQQMKQSSACSSAKTKCVDRKQKQQQKQPQKLNDSFNEMANMLESVISDVTAPNGLAKGQTGVKNKSILSAFETINQEKLNPSKVEAMQSIFENKKYAPVWRHRISNDSSDNVQPTQSNVKDDDNYYEINDLVAPPKKFIPAPVKSLGKQSTSPNSQSKRRLPSVATTAAAVPSRSEFIPSFPVTHPPPHPPPGSTNSSQTGGYYSSNSSLGAQSSPNNRLSIPSHSVGSRGMVTLTKQSLSSEAANFEEEDDGFYDNILTDEKRFSRGSELDNVSALSTTTYKTLGPVKTSSRIGQFLRKIGASKPPISAASLISLNKVASEMMPTMPIPLMKSSSLSHCKEKKRVQNMNTTVSSVIMDKRGGLGQRLKNSVFGSKKHL